MAKVIGAYYPGGSVSRYPIARIPADRLTHLNEDPRSIGIRTQLARGRGLRGVFMWELTGDDEEHSLLQAMVWPFE